MASYCLRERVSWHRVPHQMRPKTAREVVHRLAVLPLLVSELLLLRQPVPAPPLERLLSLLIPLLLSVMESCISLSYAARESGRTTAMFSIHSLLSISAAVDRLSGCVFNIGSKKATNFVDSDSGMRYFSCRTFANAANTQINTAHSMNKDTHANISALRYAEALLSE